MGEEQKEGWKGRSRTVNCKQKEGQRITPCALQVLPHPAVTPAGTRLVPDVMHWEGIVLQGQQQNHLNLICKCSHK